MRLSLSEIELIVRETEKIFGDSSKIYLFGSRVDDQQKGGDIDLYLIPENKDDLYTKKIQLKTAISERLGDQKIDLVIQKDKERLVELEAQNKGLELNIAKITLQKYFSECDKHVQRIQEAYSDLQSIIPINAAKYKTLTKQEVQALDQYLFRFSKLQDTMGDKLFKLIVEQYQQSIEQLSFIDMLNKLEKLEYINSAKEWIYLRKVRNEIAHQYDDEAEEMSQAINNILHQKSIIISIYQKVKDKYQLS